MIDHTCPNCGKKNTDHSNMADPSATPGDGDYSICIGCGHLGIFEAGRIRRPTTDELSAALKDNDVKRGLWAWVQMDKARKAGTI